MIDWIFGGALAAVLGAEMVDAWALAHLTRRCQGIRPKSSAEQRLVRWYAEGFDHSRAICGWLRAGCLVLTVLSVMLGAHMLVVAACLALTVIAHGERRFSDRLRRRFFQVQPLRAGLR